MIDRPAPGAVSPTGLGFAFAAYGIWGVLPLYFVAAAPTGAPEMVAWRIVLSFAFCILLLAITRGWHQLWVILRDGRSMALLAGASLAVLANWVLYVYAALNGHVVEAALGYFINPIVTVLLGVIVLRERLRPLQWAAVGISVIAVVVLAFNYGGLPWIALVLAGTFGTYGLIKKQVGPKVDAVSGLTIESGYVAPVALAVIIVIATTGGLTMGAIGVWHTVLLLFAGVITATPLLFFSAAARRIPLIYLGLVQYVAPALQFIVGVVVLSEPMPPARWIGFAIVWVALIVLTVDMLIHGTRQRAASMAAVAEARP